jgi:hypothetical protein
VDFTERSMTLPFSKEFLEEMECVFEKSCLMFDEESIPDLKYTSSSLLNCSPKVDTERIVESPFMRRGRMRNCLSSHREHPFSEQR